VEAYGFPPIGGQGATLSPPGRGNPASRDRGRADAHGIATNNTLEVDVGRSHLEQHVRRVLLGETADPEPETPEAEAAELAGLKRGYYLLNTDGGNAGTHPLHHARVLSQ
jgi:hypothetical protein